MNFEDLKLPDWSGPYQAVAIHTARAIYDQMREHYETKLAEAKPEPEELFEPPDMPGKKFRKLKVGEVIREGDWVASKGNPPGKGFVKTVCAGLFVESGDANNFYREVTEWRLPDPPPGRQWHRDDWTQDMLPEGYRPLLLGEPWVAGDEVLRSHPNDWAIAGGRSYDALNSETTAENSHCRTRRPRPVPVEYVPLGPEDVPPGSAVRMVGNRFWDLVTHCDSDHVWIYGNCLTFGALASNFEILRPNSTTWEPCKKPKA